MTPPPVVIVRTGSANLASVRAAFKRLSVEAVISDDPAEVEQASLLVLPGVGAFAPAIASLRRRGLDKILCSRIADDRPTLAICLGMQLMCDASEESPGSEGLGVIRGVVGRFDSGVRIPQMGWNTIQVNGARILRPETMYFANSFRLAEPPVGWTAATSDYAGPFVSAIERGNVVGCQFHPELSGAAGLGLLRRWLAVCGEASAC